MNVSRFAELPIFPSDSIYYSWSIFSRLQEKKSLGPSSLLQNHIRNSEMLHFNVNYCSKSCQCLPMSLFTRLIMHFPVAMNIGGSVFTAAFFSRKLPLPTPTDATPTRDVCGQPTANEPGGKGIKGFLALQWIHPMVPFVPQGTYHGAHYYVLLNLLPNI